MYMLPVEGESSSLVLFIDKILLVTLIKVFFSPHKVDFILQDKNSMTKSIVIFITTLSSPRVRLVTKIEMMMMMMMTTMHNT